MAWGVDCCPASEQGNGEHTCFCRDVHGVVCGTPGYRGLSSWGQWSSQEWAGHGQCLSSLKGPSPVLPALALWLFSPDSGPFLEGSGTPLGLCVMVGHLPQAACVPCLVLCFPWPISSPGSLQGGWWGFRGMELVKRSAWGVVTGWGQALGAGRPSHLYPWRHV